MNAYTRCLINESCHAYERLMSSRTHTSHKETRRALQMIVDACHVAHTLVHTYADVFVYRWRIYTWCKMSVYLYTRHLYTDTWPVYEICIHVTCIRCIWYARCLCICIHAIYMRHLYTRNLYTSSVYMSSVYVAYETQDVCVSVYTSSAYRYVTCIRNLYTLNMIREMSVYLYTRHLYASSVYTSPVCVICIYVICIQIRHLYTRHLYTLHMIREISHKRMHSHEWPVYVRRDMTRLYVYSCDIVCMHAFE